MLINGEWLTDAPTFPVFNPATGEEIGQVADGTERDATRAIDAASAALPAPRRMPSGPRSALPAAMTSLLAAAASTRAGNAGA